MSDISSAPPSDEGKSSDPSGLADKTRQFADDVKASAASHAEDGKAKGADRLAGVAETVGRVADQVAGQSPAMADWVRKAADELDGVSRNLKDKSVGDLLTMGKEFARREPAAFIAASAIAGFALSRLLKSSSSTQLVHDSAPSAKDALRPDASNTSGMADHSGEAVRPSPNSPSTASNVARPDPSEDIQPAGLARTGSVTAFPADAKSPQATGDGDQPK